MISAIISMFVFAGGILLAEFVIPQIHVGRSWTHPWDKFRNAAICGVCSAVLGKITAGILGLIFFPILLLGPLFLIAVQALANTAILFAGGFLLEDFKFADRQTIAWTATILATLQVLIARQVVQALLW